MGVREQLLIYPSGAAAAWRQSGSEVGKAANHFVAANAANLVAGSRLRSMVTERRKGSGTRLVGKARPKPFPTSSFPLSSQPPLSQQS
jgi:hypothetical protein